MPIYLQCANGHPLQVESSLCGKRIRCKKCGDVILVPSEPQSDDISSPPSATQPRSVKGELIPVDLPEIRFPRSKKRGGNWQSQPHGGEDAEDRGESADARRRAGPGESEGDFNREDIEPLDYLFEFHPSPVSRKYSIPVSIAILLLPLLIYAGLRFTVSSLPPAYLADVKRLAVQRATHELGSPQEPFSRQGSLSEGWRNDGSAASANTMPIRDVCLGGQGRYLVTYHAPKRATQGGGFVRVHDLQERTDIGKIMVAGPHVSVAASMDTLVIGGWASASLQAYQLPSLQRVQQQLVAPETAPISLAMGHASYGPLYVINSKSRLEIRELPTLDELPSREFLEKARLLFDKRSLCNASADGHVFCAQGSHLNIVHYSLGRIRGEGQSTVFASDHVAPTLSWDGSKIFTPRGIYSSSLAITDLQRRSCLAAATGPFFVGPSARTERELNKLWLYVVDHDEPIAEIPKAIAGPLAVARNTFSTPTLTNDKRLILVPSQNCIVTIGPESDEAVVHDFDFDVALSDAGLQVPYVSSIPTPRAMRGEVFEYKVEVKGIREPMFHLALAPSGMAVDEHGTIRWPCREREGSIHPVVLDVFDEHVRTTQAFNLAVGGPLVASLAGGTASPRGRAGRINLASDSIIPLNHFDPNDAQGIKRIDLPGIVRQPTLGGDGRFLVVRLLEMDSLAVIDLLNPAAVRYLPIPSSSIFAASKSRIVTFDVAEGRLQRFDLETLQSLGTGPLPTQTQEDDDTRQDPVKAMINDESLQVAKLLMEDGEFQNSPIHQITLSMGFQSDGPLLYCDRSQGLFIDVETFQAMGQAAQNAECRNLLSSRWGFRMLPRGEKFVGTYDYELPSELRGGHFDGTTISYYTPMAYPESSSQLYPGIEFVQDTFRAAVTKQVMMGVGEDRREHLAVPSADQSGYVAVEMFEGQLSVQPTTEVYRYDDAEFHKATERRKLVSLQRKDLESPPIDRRDYRGFLPWDDRLIHIPELGLLVTIPAIGNRVVVVPLEKDAQQYAMSAAQKMTRVQVPSRHDEPSRLEVGDQGGSR